MFRRLAMSLAAAVALIAQLALPASATLGVGGFAVRDSLAESSPVENALRQGRQELLLVRLCLARPRLVPVRLCVAARARLGRTSRLARMASPGPSTRPPPPSASAPPACAPPACQSAGA